MKFAKINIKLNNNKLMSNKTSFNLISPNHISSNAENLDLSDQNMTVEQLSEYIDKISTLRNLKYLNLKNNNLTTLPSEFQTCFKNVPLLRLDISNNPFNTNEFLKITAILAQITTLIDLKITITRQEEALSLLSEVPQLQRLNDKSTRDEIEIIDIDEKDIEHLSLNKEINNFNNLFMKINQSVNSKVKSTDVFKKTFDNFQTILNSEIERINNCIDASVPNYIYATSVASSKNRIYKFFLDNILELIVQFNILKEENNIRSSNITRKNSNNKIIQLKDDPNLIKQNKSVSKDKDILNEDEELIDPLAEFENENNNNNNNIDGLKEEQSKISQKDKELKNISEKQSTINSVTPRKNETNTEISNKEQIRVINDLLKLISDCGKYLSESNSETIEILTKLHPKIEEQHEFIKKLEKSENENSIMVVELERKSEQQQSLIKQQTKEIDDLKQKLIEKGDFKINNDINCNCNSRSIGQQDVGEKAQVQKVIPFTNPTSTRNNNTNINNKSSNDKRYRNASAGPGLNSINKTNTNKSGKNNYQETLNTNNNNNTDKLTNVKILTLKGLLDVINEIYSSKVVFDKKCTESNIPRETLEQHIYTFLNYKYGLKGLVIEYAAAIVNSVKQYARENVDVSLFGKMLRNDLEEDYRLIYFKLKSTLFELLVYYLKTKFPYKSSTDINELAKTKIKGVLSQEEWNAIIYFLYDDSDAKAIEQSILKIAERETNKEYNNISQGQNNYKYKKGKLTILIKITL